MPLFPESLVLYGHSQPRAGGPLRRAAGRARRAGAVAGWAVALVLAGGCKDDGTQPASTIPPAAAYDTPSDFTGEWIGEVDGQVGSLTITPLGPGRYRGLYAAEGVDIEYVLLLQQDLVSLVPSNRALFTWQDGEGGRGEGWLLINREDSALTGAFGERGLIERPWTFIRVE